MISIFWHVEKPSKIHKKNRPRLQKISLNTFLLKTPARAHNPTPIFPIPFCAKIRTAKFYRNR